MLLASKAFPSLKDETRDKLALSKYLDQLKDLQVSFGVKQHSPKTIQEAISNTNEMESYLVKSASSKVMQKDLEEQTASAVIQSIQRGLMDMMQRLVERVEQLEMTSQKNPVSQVQPSKQPLRRNQANRMCPVVCYHCGQPGYFARGHAQPRQTAPQEAPKITISLN